MKYHTDIGCSFPFKSELRMDGFRSLEIGERVRFQIRQRKEGLEAANVTGAEADGHLKGSSIRPLGKNKASFIRCFNCGQYGKHTAAKCKAVRIDERRMKVCYACRSADHLIAQCPKRNSERVDGPPQDVGRGKKENSSSPEEIEKQAV
ncbi:unnamed protein product [Toxocara canis]|uniref:CCHC-type domain-containing protein n=1 Tax=Toxocara canis TaxID=6265 RepID=A0A183U3A6_TOXCA|nr:unnamed protein product [Toxocara canis]